MKLTFPRLCNAAPVGLAIVFMAATQLVAQPPTTTFFMDNAGSGANLAGVYTSPYGGQVNYPVSAVIPVICDDFADESFVPEEWTAYVTSLSSLTPATPDTYLKWGTSNSVTGTDAVTGTWSLNQSQAYDVAALLSIDLLQSVTGSAAQQDYSFALWGLFDSTGTGPGDPGAFPWLANAGDGTDEVNAEKFLNTAIGDVKSGMVGGSSLSSYLSQYHVTIYSYDAAANPNGPSCGGGPCPASPPQEFITVTTPEASTPVLFAVDLLSFIALAMFLRKRAVRRT
jgi:hypothetical protein